MGNFLNKCGDSRRAFGVTWTSWRAVITGDETKRALKRMGCLYCVALFYFVKFLCLVLLFSLPIMMIWMGIWFYYDCPLAPIIPIYLIILGCYGIVETVIHILYNFMFCGRCEIPVMLWEFFKFIIFGFFSWGSVGIYEMYEPNYDPKNGKYCDKTLYLFAFSAVTILWIFFVLFIMMCCLFIIMLACTEGDIIDEEPPQHRSGGR